MAGVAAGTDGCDVHPVGAHVLYAASHQLPGDATLLVCGIDGDHVYHAHAFVERIQRDSGETHRPSVDNGDKHITLVARATRPDGFRLNRGPVRLVQTREDRLAQHPSN